MVKHFKISFFAFALLAAGSLLTAARSTAISSCIAGEKNKCVSISDLSVSKTSSTSVQMNWTGTGGNYNVTVTNLTTQQVEQTFTTHNTSAAVSHLTTGHTYRFEVEQSGYVIAEDVIM